MESKEKTILIVDDEEDIRELVEITLDDSVHHIATAVDGIDALVCVERSCPDLVILDWTMPGLTGPEVIEKLREDPRTAVIPVIMLTGRDEGGELIPTKVLGIFSYLRKPFSPLELLEKVQEALARC